ncbi:MAG: hypothetical protein AB7E80_03985 [Hyphomicrobiaceae bacterium]
MPRIWRYVLAHDGGRAPCIDNGMLTLCCCKPRIRKNASTGDWVVGLAPKRFGIGLVAWAGQVSAVMPMGMYRERFPERSDAIYRVVAIAADGREILRHVGGEYHSNPEAHRTDASGVNTLAFSPFWYFGRQAKSLPGHLLDLTHYYVGQTSRGSSADAVTLLRDWLLHWPPGIHGRPRDVGATAGIADAAPIPFPEEGVEASLSMTLEHQG